MGKRKGLPGRLSKGMLRWFPNLEDYEVSSPHAPGYNCIAHAAGDMSRWWEPVPFPVPGYCWPDGVVKGSDLRALKECFEAIGFEPCLDGTLEKGVVKVALFHDDDGHWTHAARQVEDGRWTSKLGVDVDIHHQTPECVSGPEYGTVGMFMRKRLRGPGGV
jgi:hypothetical protein